MGIDGISPRAIANWTDDELQILADVLNCCEREGVWPSDDDVLIVLLPKPDGGRRPIGIFPAYVRIWARARSHVAGGRELEFRRDDLYGGKGMGAHRAAWKEGLLAEVAGEYGAASRQVVSRESHFP